MSRNKSSVLKTGVKRLMQELKEMNDNPPEDLTAMPLEDNIYEWHFTMRGPADSAFAGGVYHGRVILPTGYPFDPPNIMLLTPNGRFAVGEKICLSISAHHPEHWQPAWSIRTALVALRAFMVTPGNGAIGSLEYPSSERKSLAEKSVSWRCSECEATNEELIASVPTSGGPSTTTTTTTTATTATNPSTPTVDRAANDNASGNHVGADAAAGVSSSPASQVTATSASSSSPPSVNTSSSPSSSVPQAMATHPGAAAGATTPHTATPAPTTPATPSTPAAAAAATPATPATPTTPAVSAANGTDGVAAEEPPMPVFVLADFESAQRQLQEISKRKAVDARLDRWFYALAVILAALIIRKVLQTVDPHHLH